MIYRPYCNLIVVCCAVALFFSGCFPTDQHLIPEDSEAIPFTDQPDSACSYFYFLWGTHAENNNRYNEAQEAFEKALICDPDSSHIMRRLPILLIKMGKPDEAAEWLRMLIQKFPEKSQDRLLLARLASQSGHTDKAIQLYTELITLNPKDESMYLRLGALYSDKNQYREAEQTFRQALEVNRESLFAYLYLARLALLTKKTEKAVEWYEKALALNWSADLALELAEVYSMMQNYTAVEQQYRKILREEPDDHRSGLGLVHVLLLQDKEEEALQVLAILRNSDYSTDQVDTITARLYLRSGKLEQAVALLEPIISREGTPELIYMLAVIRYQQQEYKASLDLLRSMEKDSTQYEDSIYLQVRILLEQQDREQAITLLLQNLAHKETATPGLYTLLASLYQEQNQLQKGYELLETAISRYPDNPQIYFEYGLLLEQGSQQKKAITHMKKVLELEPDHAEALNYLGYTWADNNTNLEKALKYIQRSMRLKPGNGYIQDSLGWVYFRMGKLSLAVEETLAALKFEPNDPHIHEHLGDIYVRQGKKIKAKEAYKNAEKLFTTLPDKKRVQGKIDEL